MKNIKLLLATTAILSTGALMAKALPVLEPVAESGNYAGIETINASVNLAHSLEVHEIEQLYFGTLIDPSNGDTVILNDDSDIPTGSATVSKTGSSAPHRGSIVVQGNTRAVSPQFSFPNRIELKNGETICGVATNFDVESESNATSTPAGKQYDYGATFTYDEAADDITGLCSGTGEVTVLLDIEE